MREKYKAEQQKEKERLVEGELLKKQELEER